MVAGQEKALLLERKSRCSEGLPVLLRDRHPANTCQVGAISRLLGMGHGLFEGWERQIVPFNARPAGVGNTHPAGAQRFQVAPQRFFWPLPPAVLAELRLNRFPQRFSPVRPAVGQNVDKGCSAGGDQVLFDVPGHRCQAQPRLPIADSPIGLRCVLPSFSRMLVAHHEPILYQTSTIIKVCYCPCIL
jgi:hypothetical protein